MTPAAAARGAVVYTPTSGRIIRLLSYSAFDWAVTDDEEREIVELLRDDTDLSATISALHAEGMLETLLERVDEPVNRRNLLRLLGARLSANARALVEPIIQDLGVYEPGTFGLQLQYNLGRLGISDAATPFNRSEYDDLIGDSATAPFGGSAATGAGFEERGYGDWLRAGSKMFRRRMMPIAELGTYVGKLSGKQQRALADLIFALAPAARARVGRELTRQPIGSIPSQRIERLVQVLMPSMNEDPFPDPYSLDADPRVLLMAIDLSLERLAAAHSYEELRPVIKIIVEEAAASLAPSVYLPLLKPLEGPPSDALTAEQRVRQARLLALQPIVTMFEESYAGQLPSRDRLIRAAALAYNLEPALVLAFLLAEARDQSAAEDGRDAILGLIFRRNTSVGLAQIQPAVVPEYDVFVDFLSNYATPFAATTARSKLDHAQRVRLSQSDELAIFGAARLIRALADAGARADISKLPQTKSWFVGLDLQAYREHSSQWPLDNIGALAMCYSSSAWTDEIRSRHWGFFVQQAYLDAIAAKIV